LFILVTILGFHVGDSIQILIIESNIVFTSSLWEG